MHVTSFFSFTEENSEFWSQKQTQSGSIHSIILDVHVGWQSFPLIFSPTQASLVLKHRDYPCAECLHMYTTSFLFKVLSLFNSYPRTYLGMLEVLFTTTSSPLHALT